MGMSSRAYKAPVQKQKGDGLYQAVPFYSEHTSKTIALVMSLLFLQIYYSIEMCRKFILGGVM
jgi:hypothetical protein